MNFDIGDAKHAASIDTHMKIVISYVRQAKDKYGDFRQDVAIAMEKGEYSKPEKPKVGNYKNDVDKTKEPSQWEVAQDLIRIEYKEDYRDWNRRTKDWEQNSPSVANLLWSKCTQRLQDRIKDAESITELLKDVLQMQRAVVKYATTYQPNAHPLLQVIDAVKTLFLIRQADDWKADEYERKLLSAKKIFVERL